MTSRGSKKAASSRPQRILPKDLGNVIYILSDEQQDTNCDKVKLDSISENHGDVMEILGGDPDPQSSDTSQIYQIIDHSTEDFGGENEEDKGYTETITIVSEDQNILEDEIVYVTNDNVVTSEGGQVSFVQIGGPDVASEENIETSMIVEIPEDSDAGTSHFSSDHCYTFKRGIKPKDLDKINAKAAMAGEAQSSQPAQPYTFILPKKSVVRPGAVQDPGLDTHKILEPRVRSAFTRETRCGKHRWLWQFMKELLFVGDPCLQWLNQRDGTFVLCDHDQLAVKWECYKKMHNMKAQVWRQMRYYFGWMEENKIVRPVTDSGADNLFQFVERFYREKFLPYKFKPHTDLKQISQMASEMDSVASVLCRYKDGLKTKVYCVRGCGSQFINKEACARHESVCTFVAPVSDPSS